MSDDGKRQNRYEPATAGASANEAKFNTQSLKLADDGAAQFIEQSEAYLKKVQDIYQKRQNAS